MCVSFWENIIHSNSASLCSGKDILKKDHSFQQIPGYMLFSFSILTLFRAGIIYITQRDSMEIFVGSQVATPDLIGECRALLLITSDKSYAKNKFQKEIRGPCLLYM